MAQIIGLIYGRNENWIAGSYYIENLINAIKVSVENAPEIKLYCESREQFEQLKGVTKYPKIEWIELKDSNNILDKAVNKLSYTFFRKHLITRSIYTNVDVLFPASTTFYFDNIHPKLFWIPDFQDLRLPDFFSKSERKTRLDFYHFLVNKKFPLVFSSNEAKKDFNYFFPHAKNISYILPFAVTIPELNGIHTNEVKAKYGIETPYFICSNQFWAHKNHKTVIEAMRSVKSRGFAEKLIFTGKPFDPRNPGYYSEMLKLVNDLDLADSISFLGFIDRKDQLILMKESIAVIQPSRFEGWSTSIEDAKALDVAVIASDIPVHREQLGDNGDYFDPMDCSALALRMISACDRQDHLSSGTSYQKSIQAFGKTFLEIVKKVSEK